MKRIGTVVLVVLIVVFALIGFNYVRYRTNNAVSDAAFVRTDSLTTLSFKVGGKIASMRKIEGEEVKKGELLAHIDDTDFLLARDELERLLASLHHKREALTLKRQKVAKEVELQIAMAKEKRAAIQRQIEARRAQMDVTRAKLRLVAKNLRRFQKLYRGNLVQKQKIDELQTQKDVLMATLKAQKAQIQALQAQAISAEDAIAAAKNEQKNVAILDKEIAALAKQIEAKQKALQELQNKIAYCNLYAPFTGRIAKKFVNTGRVVKKGSPIYALVDPKDLHIEVLLSEKKLKGVKKGNKVLIHIDAYPKRNYHGKVQDILPASAATFALVPRDIASGEFTKLDQRFVVRITLDDPTPDLKVGMGASVAIQRRH